MGHPVGPWPYTFWYNLVRRESGILANFMTWSQSWLFMHAIKGCVDSVSPTPSSGVYRARKNGWLLTLSTAGTYDTMTEQKMGSELWLDRANGLSHGVFNLAIMLVCLEIVCSRGEGS